MGMELGGDGKVDGTEKPCRDGGVTQGVFFMFTVRSTHRKSSLK